MIKVRLYDTPNRLSYVGYNYNRKHGWFSIHILKKTIRIYWRKNANLIP